MSRQFQIFCRRHGKIKTFNADSLPRAANGVFDLDLGVFDGATLEQCSNECLAAIEAAVIATRKLQNETPEQQRERLRKESEARGYRSPTRTTELDRKVAFVDDGKGHNKFQFVHSDPQSQPSATPAMDRSVPLANPSENSLFTNPSTGLEYVKAEVYRLAGGTESEKRIFRKMMNCNLQRLNAILAGN